MDIQVSNKVAGIGVVLALALGASVLPLDSNLPSNGGSPAPIDVGSPAPIDSGNAGQKTEDDFKTINDGLDRSEIENKLAAYSQLGDKFTLSDGIDKKDGQVAIVVEIKDKDGAVVDKLYFPINGNNEIAVIDKQIVKLEAKKQEILDALSK